MFILAQNSFDTNWNFAGQNFLYETYLSAFKYCIDNAKPSAVMGAYNRVNGEVCCGSKTLLGDILFGEFGFDGYVVSDCGAIRDIWEFHKFAPTMKEAAAVSLKTGCNLNCGESYKYLIDAYEEDLITDEDIKDLFLGLIELIKKNTELKVEQKYENLIDVLKSELRELRGNNY